MKLTRLSALLAAASVVTACGVGSVQQGAGGPQLSADAGSKERTAARTKLLGITTECPICCVAITGTSNVTVVNGVTRTYNFEINTAANGPFGIGRVNFVDNKGDAKPQNDTQEQFTIVRTECILDSAGLLIGARVFVDLDDITESVLEDVVFTLVGNPPGGSLSHVQVRTLSAAFIGGFTGAPFVAFTDAQVAQNSTQNVFPDDGQGVLERACDGIPDPGIEAIPLTLF